MWANLRRLKIFHISQFAYAFVFLPLIFSLGSIEFDPTSLLRLDQQNQARVFARELTLASKPSFAYDTKLTEVTLVREIDGAKFTFLTRAETLAKALNEQNIKFDSHLLVPEADTYLVGTPVVVTLRKGHKAVVIDGNKEIRVETVNTDPRKIALDSGLKVYPEDQVKALPLDQTLEIKIKIERATPVRLVDAGVERIVRTWSKTVGEFLGEKNIKLSGADLLTPARETRIEADMLIEITRFSDQIVKEKLSYRLGDIVRYDDSLWQGQTQVVAEGKEGLKEVTYKVFYRNNQEVGRQVLEEKVLSEAVARVVRIGTKVNIPSYVWGGSLAADDMLYKRAGAAFGVPWQILSAVHAVETGRSGDTCRTSWAGAVGPMQFLPSTWRAHAQDGDGDGDRDICSVADSVFGAAHLLSGGPPQVSLFWYNHSWSYVNLVLSIARQLGW